MDISNTPGRRVKRSLKSPGKAFDVECREIESPPGFLFDLGINREINQRSPIFQELSQVKVSPVLIVFCLCLFCFHLKFNLSSDIFAGFTG